MALQQLNTIFKSYVEAELAEHPVLSLPIFVSDPNLVIGSEGNSVTYRVVVDEQSGLASVTAGTHQTYSSVIADKGQLPIKRGVIFKKLGTMEALQNGATEILENVAAVVANQVAYDIEANLLSTIIPANFNTTGGCLSGTHLNNEGTLNFSISGLMKAAYKTEAPSLMQYAIIHPAVAQNYNIWQYIDQKSVTDTTPYRNAEGIKYIGQAYGVQYFISDLLSRTNSSSTGVYDSVVFGRNSVHFNYQINDYNIYYDNTYEAGATVVTAKVGYGMALNGVTFTGTIGTDINGVTTMGTATNWSKLTNIRNDQIRVAVLKSMY